MESAQKRFAFALLLAWMPWIPTLIGLAYTLRATWQGKATGIGVVAGGIAESLILWGLVSMIVSQVVAMAWLFRSFSREHWARNLLSAVSICASSLTLVLVGLFLWLVRRS